MVIPSRWFAGGKGLDEFRESMLADKRLRAIDDYPKLVRGVFQGWSFKGGVCYFLWDRDHPRRLCECTTHLRDVASPTADVARFSKTAWTSSSASMRRSVDPQEGHCGREVAEATRSTCLMTSSLRSWLAPESRSGWQPTFKRQANAVSEDVFRSTRTVGRDTSTRTPLRLQRELDRQVEGVHPDARRAGTGGKDIYPTGSRHAVRRRARHRLY